MDIIRIAKHPTTQEINKNLSKPAQEIVEKNRILIFSNVNKPFFAEQCYKIYALPSFLIVIKNCFAYLRF